ncbi:hypothetical protein JCM21900_000151 [Sporobolomyces salmonicolor]
MAKPAKRAAPPSARASTKKTRTSQPSPSPDSEQELSFDDFEDLEADEMGGPDEGAEESEDEFAADMGGRNKGKARETEELDEDEAEESEGDGVDGSEDDMIGDDGEDLYANLDASGGAEGSSDEEIEADGSDEEDDQDSFDNDDALPAAPAFEPTKDKKHKAKKPKPLTPAELRALAFAELTASPISNVLSTQVAELLDTVMPQAPATSPLQPLLKTLHAHLSSLPKQRAVSLEKLRKKGQIVPPVEGADGKWAKLDLEWEKPRSEDIRVIGKWAWGGGVKEKGEYVVDVAIAMPPTLLQPKDYLFPRFLVKATHYLVTLSSHLPSSLGPVSTSYSPLSGSQGYALEIRSATPKSADKTGLGKVKGAVLRLRIVSPANAFASSKLSPTSNVVRPPSLLVESENAQLNPADLPSTPLHSTALHLSSLPLLTNHLKYHHSLSLTYPSYSSSARLLQLWAARRSYGSSLGLTSEFWAWSVARSLNAGGMVGAGSDVASLAAGGEAWAGWRKALEWLAGANWTDGIWFRFAGENTYSREEFKKAYAGKPLFVDPTGTINLVAGVELSTLEMLKQDARATISLLLSGIEDERKFDNAFSREFREIERFDNFARIAIPTAPKVDQDAALDHHDSLSYLTSSISATLRRALGTRARAFMLSAPTSPSLPIDGTLPKQPAAVTLSVGILLDPVESGRLVDQGPSAEDEAACDEFRSFWGNKSELRRFKDGSIVESVVWDQPGPGGLGPQRNMIVAQIIKYILHERHGIPEGNVDVFAAAMDHLIVEPESVRRSIFLEDSVATGKGFGAVISAFDDLAKELKALPDLPLAVASVQPCSPALRYSTIFTPAPRRLKDFERLPDSAKYIEPHDILITLESSGRWPEDLEGIQKIKAAFLSKIGEGLEATRAVLTAEVAFDVDARTVDDNVSLEILTATGYAFRVRILYERSELLLEEREEQLGLTSSSSATASSLDLYAQRFVHGPKHHAAISTLQHHFTSYSHTVRLVKRWFSSHMLSPYFSPEILELLAASVFIDASSPYDPPQSGATGFARVMERLASWKWRDEPMLVPIYSFTSAVTSGRRAALPTADKAQAVASFEALRLGNPAVEEFAWVVATEEDVEGKAWGRQTGKVAAARVRGLAKATLKTLQDGVVGGGLVVEQLFSPPLGDYAFLIHLDASVIPRHFQSLAPEPRALSSRPRSSVVAGSLMGEAAEENEPIRLGWDPVADFVRQLNRLYPSIFLLFYSGDGASTIGGIWNPSVEGPRPFKVGMGFPVTPVRGEDGKAKVVLDKKAVLKDVERLGKGLVTRAEEVTR